MPVIIGITHSYADDFATLNLDYLKAIAKFNVISLILPYSENVDNLLKLVDGIILSGGGDFSEHLISEKVCPLAKNIYPKRDIFEKELCQKAFIKNIPILGICRGMQVINASLGGKLCQHIEGHSIEYPLFSKDTIIKHNINIAKDSNLFKIAKKEEALVNSFHHQCVTTIADGFTVSARCDDTVIEAIEAKNKKFCLGVQWHPEKLNDDFSNNIFKEFINACSKT